MEFEFSEQQIEFKNLIHAFAKARIAPFAPLWDETEQFPLETVLELGEMGAFGIIFPESYGGLNLDFTTLCIAIEELARFDSSIAITLSAAVGLGATPIYLFGTDEQKQKYLPDMCAGRSLGAFGLTEPDAGSDASALKTSATFDPSSNTWSLNGSKAFITNSGTSITTVTTVAARVKDGFSAFLVPRGTPGLTVGQAYRKMGWHASDTHPLYLDDVKIGPEGVLGEMGHGLSHFLSVLDNGRIAIAALAVGLAQGCLDEATSYAKSRIAFGGPIGRNQAIAFALSDMAANVEAARLLTYKAAWKKDNGQNYTQAAAIAKLMATQYAVDATRTATQIFGGMGFIEGTTVVRHYRDAKILEIGEGSSEIQRIVIARSLGLPVP